MFLSILRLIQSFVTSMLDVSRIHVRRTYCSPWTCRD
jgi:hypothetical protein